MTSPKIPTYRKHSVRDLAFVEVSGKRLYLPGAYDSPESRQAYADLVRDLLAGSRETAEVLTQHQLRGRATLTQLVAAWIASLEAIEHHNELTHARGLARVITREMAALPAAEFGPRRLLELQQRMVAKGWSRGYANDQLGRFRRMFRWGVQQELFDAAVWQNLKAVEGLKKGRTEAAEPRDVQPAPVWDVGRVLRRVTPTMAAMIRTQYRTGMRSHHLCALRMAEVDQSGDVWIYRPLRHEKGRAKKLAITIGPKTQRVLRPLLERPADAYVFDPRDACRQAGREPSARIRDHYDRDSYRRAITRACRNADVRPWHPHQLRHSAGTNARRVAGLEAAQALLGHDHADVTQIYAEKHLGIAVEVARKIG